MVQGATTALRSGSRSFENWRCATFIRAGRWGKPPARWGTRQVHRVFGGSRCALCEPWQVPKRPSRGGVQSRGIPRSNRLTSPRNLLTRKPVIIACIFRVHDHLRADDAWRDGTPPRLIKSAGQHDRHACGPRPKPMVSESFLAQVRSAGLPAPSTFKSNRRFVRGYRNFSSRGHQCPARGLAENRALQGCCGGVPATITLTRCRFPVSAKMGSYARLGPSQPIACKAWRRPISLAIVGDGRRCSTVLRLETDATERTAARRRRGTALPPDGFPTFDPRALESFDSAGGMAEPRVYSCKPLVTPAMIPVKHPQARRHGGAVAGKNSAQSGFGPPRYDSRCLTEAGK